MSSYFSVVKSNLPVNILSFGVITIPFQFTVIHKVRLPGLIRENSPQKVTESDRMYRYTFILTHWSS